MLFLGIDDFARLELHGARLVFPPTIRQGKTWKYGDPRDFDSSPPRQLDQVEFAIVPRGSYRSEPPANFELIDGTESYELWRRSGPTPAREVLNERAQPGAVLGCRRKDGRSLANSRGWARVWATPPRTLSFQQQALALQVGEEADAALQLEPGRWKLSLAYTSPQRVRVLIPERRWTRTLPANLDRPGPFWPVGQLHVAEPRALRVRIEVEASPLGATTHLAQIITLAAVRADQVHELVPLAAACGRYVDWYTLGPKRAPTQ